MKYADYKGTDPQYMIELLQAELAECKQANTELRDALREGFVVTDAASSKHLDHLLGEDNNGVDIDAAEYSMRPDR